MVKFNNPPLKFIILFIPSILLWFTFYSYLYKINNLLDINIDFLSHFSFILSKQANLILGLFKLTAITEVQGDMVVSKLINYEYSHGVWIGEPCNGIKVFGLFSIFIICFKGKWYNKLWFIPSGILIIHFFNIIRIASLTYISAINPYWLNFNHNITFQLIIYALMSLIWYVWIKKFSEIIL